MKLPWRKRERSDAEVMAGIRHEFALWGLPLDRMTDDEIARACNNLLEPIRQASVTIDQFAAAMNAAMKAGAWNERHNDKAGA